MKTRLTILLFYCSCSLVHALDFYWKGGSGDFNDPQMWAIGHANGQTAVQAPISTDNVYFVASTINSVTENHITFNTNANCHDFWIDSMVQSTANLVFISQTNQTLDIYGSMELAPVMQFNFAGILRFRSIENGIEVIRMAGNQLKLMQVEFDGGSNTEWQLQDSFLVDDYLLDVDNWDWGVPTGTVLLYNGTINSNHQTMVMDFFYSKNNSANRGIIFDSSSIVLRGYNGGDAKAWWVDFDVNSANYTMFSTQGTYFHFAQNSGLKQYGAFGTGMHYDYIIGYSDLSISGIATFAYLQAEGSAYFVDVQLSVGDLHLSATYEHFFNSNSIPNNDYLEIEHFNSPSNCSDFVVLRGFAKTKGRIRKKYVGQLVLEQVILQDMECDISGGRSYLVNNGIDGGGNSSNWSFQQTNILKMKFVDSGNQLWSDPNNWQLWDGNTWGANTLNCIPTPFTDVYIEMSSFTQASKWLIIDVVANCRNMNWNITMAGGGGMQVSQRIRIFGGASFSGNMGLVQNQEAIYFYGRGDTLRTNGLSFVKLIFWKHADYTIADNISTTEFHGWLYSTIRGKNITITTNELSLGNRFLDSVWVNITGTFYDFGATSIQYLGNTTFNYTPTTSFVNIRTQKEYAYSNSVYLPNVYSHGVRLQFTGVETFVMGDLELLGDADLRVNSMQITGTMSNYSGKMILHAGHTYAIKNAMVADTLVALGTCNEVITIRPYGGSVGTVSLSAVHVSSCFIQGINNIGNTVVAMNCIDGGTNTGWSFSSSAGVKYYWRASALDANDFEGNWSDPNHWTTNVSDLTGTLGGCMPTLADTVVFDQYSFSATSNGCNIDKTAFCNGLYCEADVRITGDELYVGGDFVLYNNMQHYEQRGVIYFIGSGVNHINLNNTRLENCGVVFNNRNGEWLLDNDFYLHDSVHQCYTGFVLDAGVFRANNYEITIRGRFRADRTDEYRVLDIRNTTVNMLCNDRYNSYYGLTWDISNATGMQILSENSVLNFHDNTSSYAFSKYFYMGNGLVYNKVNFLDKNDYMRVYNDANYGYAYFEGTATMYGSNRFDSLALTGGYHWYLKNNKVQTLAEEHGKIIAYGNASDFVYIESTNAGQKAYIHKEYGTAFCMDYVKIKDIEGTKGVSDPVNASRHQVLFFETGENSDNINQSATGIWRFELSPSVNVVLKTDSVAYFCNGGEPLYLPLEFTGAYPYNLIIKWEDDMGQTGVDTMYYQDTDNNVYTASLHTLALYPKTNTDYTLEAAGMRCGERYFIATPVEVKALMEKGTLANQSCVGNCYLENKDYYTHFFNQAYPIASIQDKKDVSDAVALGNTDVHVYCNTTVPLWNSLPYLPRHWKIDPEHKSGGKVRLYFYQQELDALSTAYYGAPGINVQHDLTLLRFEDTIMNGNPVTIPYTVVPMAGYNTIPFSNWINVIAIEFEDTEVGAYMLRINALSIVFPLELLDFNARKEGAYDARITWETAQEVDIKLFEIERSADGIDFERVGSVQPKLSLEKNHYTFLDEQPSIPFSYYRLKIIEEDGSSSYSSTRVVEFEQPRVPVQVVPNPANQAVNVILELKANQILPIQVYDMLGRLVESRMVDGQQGGTTKLTFNTTEWEGGVYLIRIHQNEQEETIKLLVQH